MSWYYFVLSHFATMTYFSKPPHAIGMHFRLNQHVINLRNGWNYIFMARSSTTQDSQYGKRTYLSRDKPHAITDRFSGSPIGSNISGLNTPEFPTSTHFPKPAETMEITRQFITAWLYKPLHTKNFKHKRKLFQWQNKKPHQSPWGLETLGTLGVYALGGVHLFQGDL